MVSAMRVMESSRRREWQWTCNQAGDTALHLAARGGHVQVVGLLLRSRASLDPRNVQGESALHAAVGGGFAEIAQLLCDAEADPRLGELRDNEVPGFWAVRRHAEWVQSRQRGATDEPSENPAPRKQHRKRLLVCVEACLEAMQRWDPSAPAAASLVNSTGSTGLHVAAEAASAPTATVTAAVIVGHRSSGRAWRLPLSRPRRRNRRAARGGVGPQRRQAAAPVPSTSGRSGGPRGHHATDAGTMRWCFVGDAQAAVEGRCRPPPPGLARRGRLALRGCSWRGRLAGHRLALGGTRRCRCAGRAGCQRTGTGQPAGRSGRRAPLAGCGRAAAGVPCAPAAPSSSGGRP